MGLQIEGLAQFVAQTQWEDIPEPVQRHAKLVLLDTLGVILAGAERPEVRELRDALAGTAGTGATVFARGWPTHDPRTAALLNGIAGRSIELCEGLRFVSGQAAMQVLPGVLAVGEHLGSSGRDMLAAFVLGYDVAARLAGGFTPRPLAHQNGQVSLLAAAAAGARLHGLDAAGISRAMRIATTLLLTPSYTNAVAGATALNVAGGMSGFAAALAPELARAGFAGAGRRDRGGARRSGRKRVHARSPARRPRHGLAHHPQLFPALRLLQPDPPGARLPPGGAGRIAARSPTRSSASTSRPTVSLRSCATRTRRIISPPNTRCRMPPRRWWCAAAPASPRSTTPLCTTRRSRRCATACM